jgi:hypothetical protein
MTNEKIQYTAIQCRIPSKIYNDVQLLIDITDKSIAAFIGQSVEYYIASLKEEEPEANNKTFKLDKYAWQLANEETRSGLRFK